MENNISFLFSLGSLICAFIAVMVSLRRSKYQNVADGTQGLLNLQKTVTDMQEQHQKDRDAWAAELKKEKAEKELILRELNQIKTMLREANLEIRINMGIGQEPKIVGWEWATKEHEAA